MTDKKHPFQKFQALAAKLFQTPKKEVEKAEQDKKKPQKA